MEHNSFDWLLKNYSTLKVKSSIDMSSITPLSQLNIKQVDIFQRNIEKPQPATLQNTHVGVCLVTDHKSNFSKDTIRSIHVSMNGDVDISDISLNNKPLCLVGDADTLSQKGEWTPSINGVKTEQSYATLSEGCFKIGVWVLTKETKCINIFGNASNFNYLLPNKIKFEYRSSNQILNVYGNINGLDISVETEKIKSEFPVFIEAIVFIG